jgi:hypothetical protein
LRAERAVCLAAETDLVGEWSHGASVLWRRSLRRHPISGDPYRTC